MKKWGIAVSILSIFLLIGCHSSNSADEYKECIKEYENQGEQNGGNGGFVDSKTFCE